jgi:hypothetical protein
MGMKGMDGNGWEWWEWWEWDDKCGLKKGHWCGKLMHKIPGSLQRELETSRNVDDGWPWKKRRLSAEDWWTFPMGFPRFRVPQRSWLERLAAIASHGLDEFPETSDGNGEKLGGFRFQYVQGSIGWLRMQVDAASDDFFNTDHSMFWCLAIILRCFQPPSWMSFTWPSNCERSATLEEIVGMDDFTDESWHKKWPLHSWWVICVLLEFPTFQATICCKML